MLFKTFLEQKSFLFLLLVYGHFEIRRREIDSVRNFHRYSSTHYTSGKFNIRRSIRCCSLRTKIAIMGNAIHWMGFNVFRCFMFIRFNNLNIEWFAIIVTFINSSSSTTLWKYSIFAFVDVFHNGHVLVDLQTMGRCSDAMCGRFTIHLMCGRIFKWISTGSIESRWLIEQLYHKIYGNKKNLYFN